MSIRSRSTLNGIRCIPYGHVQSLDTLPHQYQVEKLVKIYLCRIEHGDNFNCFFLFKFYVISLTLGLGLLFPWILGIFSAFLAKLGYQFGSLLEYFYLKNKYFLETLNMPTICKMKIEVQNFMNNNIFIVVISFFNGFDSQEPYVRILLVHYFLSFSFFFFLNLCWFKYSENVTRLFFFFRSYSFVFHFWTIAYHNYFWSIH